uniref:Uncharacterized protein n=1 Tax=Anguilla anguilla TaxID=7936 RepID=A0A0E9UK07_ANGAN
MNIHPLIAWKIEQDYFVLTSRGA